jgi:serine/threonine protein kinase
MATGSIPALADIVRATGLLDTQQLAELTGLQSQFTDPKAFARALLERGWLTPFQVNQLLQGKDLSLGQYILLERLGEGGMGQVFKARHRRLDRVDAVKVIRKEHLANAVSLQRFQQEARATARLAHPNIVTVYDASESGGTHFLAMEYVEGTDLARLLKQSGPLPIGQACEYIRQAALGLQHAHERGLVHRDIKPSNLFLNPATAMVKVLDLGLAVLESGSRPGDPTAMLTKTGAVMGTPDFIAPEQAINPSKVDIRADIYSLGASLYYLLTAELPFPGGTHTEKLLKRQLEDPKRISQLRRDVPKELEKTIARMMARHPDDRYQTPLEVAQALEPFVAGFAPTMLMAAASGYRIPAVNGNQGTALASHWCHVRSAARTAMSWLPARRKHRVLLAGIAGGTLGTLLVLCLVTTLFRGHGRPTELPPSRLQYISKATREDTILATLKANQMPALEGPWYFIGPFDRTGNPDFDNGFPSDVEVDLKKTLTGRGKEQVGWREYPGFRLGAHNNLGLFNGSDDAVVYLYQPVQTPAAVNLPISLDTTDPLMIWVNDARPLASQLMTTARQATLPFKAGKNHLLIKSHNQRGNAWTLNLFPQFPDSLALMYGLRLQLDFLRDVIEGENLKIAAKSSNFPTEVQDMRGITSSWWRSGSQLRAQPSKVGEWIEFEVPIVVDDNYRISVYLTKSPENGIVQFDLQGRPLGEAIDCYSADQTVNSGSIFLGAIRLRPGPIRLRAQVIGTNDRSTGGRYGLGIDCIVLSRRGNISP